MPWFYPTATLKSSHHSHTWRRMMVQYNGADNRSVMPPWSRVWPLRVGRLSPDVCRLPSEHNLRVRLMCLDFTVAAIRPLQMTWRDMTWLRVANLSLLGHPCSPCTLVRLLKSVDCPVQPSNLHVMVFCHIVSSRHLARGCRYYRIRQYRKKRFCE